MLEQSRVFSTADFLPRPRVERSADPTGPHPARPNQPFPVGGSAVPGPHRLIKTHQEGDVRLAAEQTLLGDVGRTSVCYRMLMNAPPGRAPSPKPTSPTPPKPLWHLQNPSKHLQNLPNASKMFPTLPKPLQCLQTPSDTSKTPPTPPKCQAEPSYMPCPPMCLTEAGTALRHHLSDGYIKILQLRWQRAGYHGDHQKDNLIIAICYSNGVVC